MATEVSDEMKKIKEKFSKKVFGMSISEAQAKGICIQCRKPALENCYSEAGKKEYAISGLCEKCFDEITM